MSSLNLMRVLVVKEGTLHGTVNPCALVLDGLTVLETED
jgi:hypothetical protein